MEKKLETLVIRFWKEEGVVRGKMEDVRNQTVFSFEGLETLFEKIQKDYA